MFSNHEAHFLPEKLRKDMARERIAQQIAGELQHGCINMKCTRDKRDGTELWTGTLLAVIGDTESWES